MSNACFVRDAARVLVALDLADSRQSYVGGVALSREPLKLQQAKPLLAKLHHYRALLPSYDTRCWRAELGLRNADLQREAAAVIAAKPASAMLYDTAVWYLVWACWHVGVCFVVG